MMSIDHAMQGDHKTHTTGAQRPLYDSEQIIFELTITDRKGETFKIGKHF